jgi:hypothetical protein
MVTAGSRDNSGGCIISTNGVNWTARPPLPFTPRLLRTFGSQFVILGTIGQVATSTDNGVTWITRAQSPLALLSSAIDLLYNTTTSNFIAVGYIGGVWTTG